MSMSSLAISEGFAVRNVYIDGFADTQRYIATCLKGFPSQYGRRVMDAIGRPPSQGACRLGTWLSCDSRTDAYARRSSVLQSPRGCAIVVGLPRAPARMLHFAPVRQGDSEHTSSARTVWFSWAARCLLQISIHQASHRLCHVPDACGHGNAVFGKIARSRTEQNRRWEIYG